MIINMGTLRITEAELARNVRAVLAEVEHGSEVIIEQEDHRPVAVIRSPHRSGRPITEILREARQRNSTVTLDEDFGKDLEEIIASHQQPWNPPSWELNHASIIDVPACAKLKPGVGFAHQSPNSERRDHQTADRIAHWGRQAQTHHHVRFPGAWRCG